MNWAAIEVSRKHLSQVVNGHKRVEPVLAAKLAKVLGTTAQFWLNLQAEVDAWDAVAAVEGWEPGRELPAPAAA